MLQAIMEKVANVEQTSQPVAYNSIHPLEPRPRPAVQLGNVTSPNTTVFGPNSLINYLPCHYFDYIVGTSTGG